MTLRSLRSTSPIRESRASDVRNDPRSASTDIFVDAHRWPEGKQVYLNGQAREVAMVTLPDGSRSPELYEAMKADPALQAFP